MHASTMHQLWRKLPFIKMKIVCKRGKKRYRKTPLLLPRCFIIPHFYKLYLPSKDTLLSLPLNLESEDGFIGASCYGVHSRSLKKFTLSLNSCNKAVFKKEAENTHQLWWLHVITGIYMTLHHLPDAT